MLTLVRCDNYIHVTHTWKVILSIFVIPEGSLVALSIQFPFPQPV